MAQALATKWKELSNGLDDIYAGVRLGIQRSMKLYSHVYDYGRNPLTKCIEREKYKELYEKLATYLENYVNQLGKEFQQLHGIKLLEHYHCVWEKFRTNSEVVDFVFRHLKAGNLKPVEDETYIFGGYNLAVDFWKKIIFENVVDDITNTLFELILSECSDGSVSTAVLGSVLNSYLEMGMIEDPNFSLEMDIAAAPDFSLEMDIDEDPDFSAEMVDPKNKFPVVFKTYFESKYFQLTQLYYSPQAYYFLTLQNPAEYLKQVEERFNGVNNENGRDDVDYNRVPSNFEWLMQMCDEIFIKNERLRGILDFAIEKCKEENIVGVFDICEQIGGALEALGPIIERHIESKVLSQINNVVYTAKDNPKNYVNEIVSARQHFNSLYTYSYKYYYPLLRAVDKALTNFINHAKNDKNPEKQFRSTELLAGYIDSLLRKFINDHSDNEIEEAFNQIMVVFKYIEDKDELQKYYSKFLAKRLLNGFSANEYYESLMLQKLQHECGLEYTAKLQRMCTDITVSKELTHLFKQQISDTNNDSQGINFSVMVLTNGFWPFHYYRICSLPSVLRNVIEKFEELYIARHSGRKLTFLQHLSHGEIICNFYNRKYGFLASTAQMAILLKFNDKLNFSLQELIDSLEFKHDTLLTVLQPMLNIGLIIFDGAESLDANTPMDTVLNLNPNFCNKKLKINFFKAINRNGTRKEETDVLKTLDADRRMLIQSAIVRVLKMRKTISHSALMSEVIQQLSGRFKPNIPVIKKCIQLLIEKEYLARVEGVHDSYKYLS